MPRFTDASLIGLINKASRRVNRELCLFGTSDEITVDASGCIFPQDGTLEDLVILQTECMIASRDVNMDLSTNGAGIHAVDGEQTLDTRTLANSRLSFLNSEHGPCSEYKKQIVIEKLKRTAGYDIW
jgi:hypothetical protein